MMPTDLPALPAPPRPIAYREPAAVWGGRLLLLALVLLFPALDLLNFGPKRRQTHAFLADGRHAEGHVSEWSEEGGFRGSPTYWIHYRFAVDGTEYRGRSWSSPAAYRSTPIGGPCDVLYLPADPRVNWAGPIGERVRGERVARDAMWFGLTPMFAAVWLGVEWWLARERRLARWGVLAVGDVVAWEGRDGRGRAGPWLRYRFTGPNGEALGGEVKAWPELLLTPRRVSEIPIIYDPRRPARHRPLGALRAAVPVTAGEPAPINKE
jgi:hypothetical protein